MFLDVTLILHSNAVLGQKHQYFYWCCNVFHGWGTFASPEGAGNKQHVGQENSVLQSLQN